MSALSFMSAERALALQRLLDAARALLDANGSDEKMRVREMQAEWDVLDSVVGDLDALDLNDEEATGPEPVPVLTLPELLWRGLADYSPDDEGEKCLVVTGAGERLLSMHCPTCGWVSP